MAEIVAIMGQRGTGSLPFPDIRTKSWRAAITRMDPNGTAPLTALTNYMKSERVNDPEFNWFTKILSKQAFTVSGIFDDDTLATPTNAQLVVGQIIYIQSNEAELDEFRPGHTIILTGINDQRYSVRGYVMDKVMNGLSSYISVRIVQASAAGFPVSAATTPRVIIIGNANPEGGTIPRAISYEPKKIWNYTQIFRTPLKITRTALRTHVRTGDKYQELKRDALLYHGLEMEKAFILGVPAEYVGYNDQPERLTGGLLWATQQGGFVSDASRIPGSVVPVGTPWINYGMDYMDEVLKTVFLYGKKEKLVLMGNGAMLGLNQLARANGWWEFTPATAEFGINISRWRTPFGVLNMMTHPLFNQEQALQHAMLIFEPQNLRFRYIDDTFFKKDDFKSSRMQGMDGLQEEFLTEAGLEFGDPIAYSFLDGVGLAQQAI